MVNSALLLASEGFLDWLQNVDRAALLAVNGSDSLFLDSVVHVLTTAITWLPLYLSLFYLVVKNHNSLRHWHPRRCRQWLSWRQVRFLLRPCLQYVQHRHLLLLAGA